MNNGTFQATAQLLDGRALADRLQAEIAARVETYVQQFRAAPTLAAVHVGDDPASSIYIRNKRAACKKVGIESRLYRLPESIAAAELERQIDQLNEDSSINGILVQLPLPPQIAATRVLDRIDPLKDVDAFHPLNVGLLVQGRPRFLPCTPHGVLQILIRNGLTVAGKHVVVVGRSEIVGKPLAILLSAKDSPLGPEMANATVTLCHSRTKGLAELTRRADILVAAMGRPGAITASMVQPSAIVIDVGINRTEKGIVGDVDFEGVSSIASYITPVPGGIGPLTVTMLLSNTLHAAQLQRIESESTAG
jgi:methylenetetrahydrofolate dehydrogenase (NADP+)/methenyltetrahydrofolate cyclohydrolase